MGAAMRLSDIVAPRQMPTLVKVNCQQVTHSPSFAAQACLSVGRSGTLSDSLKTLANWVCKQQGKGHHMNRVAPGHTVLQTYSVPAETLLTEIACQQRSMSIQAPCPASTSNNLEF